MVHNLKGMREREEGRTRKEGAVRGREKGRQMQLRGCLQSWLLKDLLQLTNKSCQCHLVPPGVSYSGSLIHYFGGQPNTSPLPLIGKI